MQYYLYVFICVNNTFSLFYIFTYMKFIKTHRGNLLKIFTKQIGCTVWFV